MKVLDSLIDEHAHMARVLDVLEAELHMAPIRGRPDYPVVAGILDYFTSYPDLFHHPKEDFVLRVMEFRDSEAAKAVGDLEAEHEKLAGMVHKLAFTATRKALASGEDEADTAWFMSTIRNFLDVHRHHMLMENEHFFPAAKTVLTNQDWDEIDVQMSWYNTCFRRAETRKRVDGRLSELLEGA